MRTPCFQYRERGVDQQWRRETRRAKELSQQKNSIEAFKSKNKTRFPHYRLPPPFNFLPSAYRSPQFHEYHRVPHHLVQTKNRHGQRNLWRCPFPEGVLSNQRHFKGQRQIFDRIMGPRKVLLANKARRDAVRQDKSSCGDWREC